MSLLDHILLILILGAVFCPFIYLILDKFLTIGDNENDK